MKNTFGSSVSVTLFGESHGPAIGAVLDGLAPGIPVDEDFIRSQLSLRRSVDAISTARREPDEFQIVSGVVAGKTTGTPLTVLIPNQDVKSADYTATQNLARPGHADYTARVKYHGFEDARGGGHFSGRLTAPLVAAGAIAIDALRKKGILIGSHIARCAGIDDIPFSDLAKEIPLLNTKAFAVLDEKRGEAMKAAILAAAKEGDSVGGCLSCAVTGLPAGLGEPWFDSAESLLSHALFSIPAVKGVSFGDGFGFCDLKGSEANDPLRTENGQIVFATNRNGGINGGITNGMPLLFSLAVKPTPSIYKEQKTVDLASGTEADLVLKGRHDPAIVHRARVVADSVTALVLCDLLALRYGTDWLA